MLSHRWKITLFGGPRLDNPAGTVVERFATQKTGLLLAYLALHIERPAHARETLAELLWPDVEPEAARHSLRQAVASLRRQLEPPGTPRGAVLIAHGHLSLSLNPDALEVDTVAFENALREAARQRGMARERAALEKAVSLYTADLLPGCFDDWALTERQRLADACRNALRELGALCQNTGQTDAALSFAHRLAALSPLDEAAQADLIRLYRDGNLLEEARQHYDAYVRRLSEQLNESPSRELTSLLSTLPTAVKGTPSPSTLPPDRQPPAPNTQSFPSHRPPLLPTPLTRFFGRVDERERLDGMLGERTTRLVTLTGPGGSGKTRLAVEAARAVSRDRFSGIVAFVTLADETSAVRLPETVRASLTAGGLLPPRPSGDPMMEIVACLSGAASLLVLDNFEQLADDGTPFVRELLERVPILTCLVTSRRSLGMPGERELPVPPLPVPPLPGTPARLMEFASVQLFVDRAQAVRPDFQVTERNADTMAALCYRLDGIPLAIELAAARARALAPAQILAQLEDRFAFLQSRDPNAPARHRTLFAAVDGSVRVLPPELRRFFLRLCVFRGGWALDAAREVAGEEGADEAATLDALERLCQASLIVPTDAGETVRFRMLETLREYALSEIEREERRDAERRHAAFFIAFVEKTVTELVGAGQADALRAFDIERENLRAALAALSMGNDAPGRLRLVAAQAMYWALRGEFHEGRTVLEETFTATIGVTTADAPDAPRLRTRIADALASICAQSGDFVTAEEYARRSLSLSRDLADDFGIARSLNNLGSMALDRMQFQQAEVFLSEGLVHAVRTGNRQMAAAMRNNLSLALMETGRLDTAETLYTENLALRREIGDTRGVAMTLLNLADVHIRRRDGVTACRLYCESLILLREVGDMPQTATALEGLGEALILSDTHRDMSRCAFLFGVAVTLRERTGAHRRPSFQAAYSRFEALLRERLGETEYMRHYEQGQHTPLDQVLDDEITQRIIA